MKKFLDILRKLGLLQVSSGDYMTGEFDSRSDLKSKPKTEAAPSDGETTPPPNDGGAATPPAGSPETQPSKGRRGVGIFWAILIVAILLLLLLLSSSGFSLWFFILLVLWAIFLYKTHASIAAGTIAMGKMWIIVVILLVLTIASFGESEEGDSLTKNTAEQVPIGTMLDLVSEDGAVINTAVTEITDYGVRVSYRVIIDKDLPVNKRCYGGNSPFPCRGIDNYNYVTSFTVQRDGELGPKPERLWPVFCDGGAKLSDVIDPLNEVTCWFGKPETERTGQFYTSGSYVFESYNDVPEAFSTFTVYDAKPFVTREHNVEEDGKSSGMETIDTFGAVEEGDVVAEFTMIPVGE